jgi:SHS2 domain-containing protein
LVEQDPLKVKVRGSIPRRLIFQLIVVKTKNYELIEHTADIGIRVRGKDLKELFKNTALVLFGLIAEKKEPVAHLKKEKVEISLKADSLEELFVNWLNELLFLSVTGELFFSGFQIMKLTQNSLEACVCGESFENYKIKSEIKAATYHGLKIEKAVNGWKAEVIFDV